jgi:Multicopper oxidase
VNNEVVDLIFVVPPSPNNVTPEPIVRLLRPTSAALEDHDIDLPYRDQRLCSCPDAVVGLRRLVRARRAGGLVRDGCCRAQRHTGGQDLQEQPAGNVPGLAASRYAAHGDPRRQVVGRTPFDAEAYENKYGGPTGVPGGIDPTPFITGPGEPAGPTARGFKDTVKANPGYLTRIRAKYELPDAVTAPQTYVYHCHIVEHEDNDMMRPYTVEP